VIFFVLCNKSLLQSNKVCYKVSLCETSSSKVLARLFPYLRSIDIGAKSDRSNQKFSLELTHLLWKMQTLADFYLWRLNRNR